MRAWMIASVAGTLALGCSSTTAGKGSAATPDASGKTDVANAVSVRGTLGFDEAIEGQFESDLQFDGYTFPGTAGDTIGLELTQLGSARGLDTTLYVYGPDRTAHLGFDDDAGWGPLSRIDALTLPEEGEYLVVVGTHDGLGRGQYRLEATCEGTCATPEPIVCEGGVFEGIVDCMEEVEAESDYRTIGAEAFDICLTDHQDWLYSASCEGSRPDSFCTGSFEDFARDVIPACRTQLRDRFTLEIPELEPEVVDEGLENTFIEAMADCSYCYAEISAYRVPAGTHTELVLQALRQKFDRSEGWAVGDDGRSSLDRTYDEHGLDGFEEEVIAAFGAGYLSNLHHLHRNFYPAAGAEAWEDLYGLELDNGVIVLLLVGAAEE